MSNHRRWPPWCVALGLASALAAGTSSMNCRAPSGQDPPPSTSTTNPAPTNLPVTEAEAARPEPPEQECERIRASLLAGLRGEGASEAGELVALARRLVDPEQGGGSSCGGEFVRALRETTRCSPAVEAIASGVVAGGGLAPDDLAAQLRSASAPCKAAWVEAVQASPKVSRSLLEAMDLVARTAPDEETKRSAWLGLGTLGLTARQAKEWDEVSEAERLLRSRLLRARGTERTTAIEAAGNAGCELCEGHLQTLARDDAATVRRSAFSALRFLSSSKAVEGMCRGLLKDASTMVREQTAWAMRWSSSQDQERIECLITSAATDPSERVKLESAQSLAVLAPQSKRAESALVHLTGSEVHPSVRRVALEALSDLWRRRPVQDGFAAPSSE